jgi:hypothetical protein
MGKMGVKMAFDVEKIFLFQNNPLHLYLLLQM